MAPNAPPIACTLSVRGMARRALCRARCGAGNSTSSSAPNGSANSAFRKMRQGCQDVLHCHSFVPFLTPFCAVRPAVAFLHH
jgi:hypothetical protein